MPALRGSSVNRHLASGTRALPRALPMGTPFIVMSQGVCACRRASHQSTDVELGPISVLS